MLERAQSQGQLIIDLDSDDEKEDEIQEIPNDLSAMSVKQRVNMLVRMASSSSRVKRTATPEVKISKIDSTALQWRKREEEYKQWLAEQERSRAELEERKRRSEVARSKRKTLAL
jgi:hypothetical protein